MHIRPAPCQRKTYRIAPPQALTEQTDFFTIHGYWSEDMAEKVENLILERLKRIDHRLENIADDISELKTRATAVDEHIGGMFITLSGVNARLDRIDDRMKRIERRLDLSEVS